MGEPSRLRCFSQGKVAKEFGLDTFKEKRLCEDLARLQIRVRKGNIKATDQINQRIARIRKR